MDDLETVAKQMFLALVQIQLYAEEQVTDICASIQEGDQWTPEKKMELDRWSSIGNAIDGYSSFIYRRDFAVACG